MKRDEFACRHCKSKEKTLNVHHCFYEKGKKPWEYKKHTLVTLCEDCHKLEEKRNRIILTSCGNSQETGIALVNTLFILGESGPFSHPVFSCLMRSILSVCREYETMISSAEEPNPTVADIESKDEQLAQDIMKSVACMMEIRCLSNSIVESAMMKQ